MSFKRSLWISFIAFLIVGIEMLIYIVTAYGPAFIGGDVRGTLIFVPFIGTTLAVAILTPVFTLLSKVVRRSLVGWLVLGCVGIFAVLFAVSMYEVWSITQSIREHQKVSQALPKPPEPPFNQSADWFPEERWKIAEESFGIAVPSKYYWQAVHVSPQITYGVLEAVGAYNEFPKETWPHVIVLLKAEEVMGRPLPEAIQVFFQPPLDQLYSPDSLKVNSVGHLLVDGEMVDGLNVTYQGAQGFFGQLHKRNCLFLVWGPKGYALQPSAFAWLFRD